MSGFSERVQHGAAKHSTPLAPQNQVGISVVLAFFKEMVPIRLPRPSNRCLFGGFEIHIVNYQRRPGIRYVSWGRCSHGFGNTSGSSASEAYGCAQEHV